MEIRNILVCSADFPPDVIGDDGQEKFRPNGFALIHAVTSILCEYGMEVTKVEADLEHHAWELNVNWQYRKIWILASVICEDEVVFEIHDNSSLFSQLFRGKDIFRDFLQTFQKLLSNDSRFSDFLWYKVYDAAHEGHPTPVD